MNSAITEALTDIRIELEVAALTEDEIYPYLAAALEGCGVEHLEPTLEGLLEQAVALVERSEPPKKPSELDNLKMVFGVLRRVAQPVVKAATWGAGRAVQGLGHVVNRLGKKIGDAGAGMQWQPGKRPAPKGVPSKGPAPKSTPTKAPQKLNPKMRRKGKAKRNRRRR